MNRKLRYALGVLGIAAAGAASASITFYDGENFTGRDFSVDQTVSNFGDTRFNDRARSAVVDAGQWEVCVDANFRGTCQVLGPGRYPDLGGLAERVSSVRPYSNMAMQGRGEHRPMAGNYGGSRATLYEGRDLSGRSFPLGNGTLANLDGTGFNDRASSLRVEGGYWVFCSDANFGGECRTFGPGDYASLPPGLSDRISSGRRISNDYPYSQNPNWQR
ncbi:MAG: beta/gamma crystallin-related protein [Betaproteobacteria bacterium]